MSADLINDHTLIHAAGFFAEFILLKHDCGPCKQMLLSSNLVSAGFPSAKFGLLRPSPEFTDFISTLERNFQLEFMRNVDKQKITKTILGKLSTIANSNTCQNFPKDLFLTFFIRTRMHYSLKYMNEHFKQHSSEMRYLHLDVEI